MQSFWHARSCARKEIPRFHEEKRVLVETKISITQRLATGVEQRNICKLLRMAVMLSICHHHGRTQHGYTSIERSEWEASGLGKIGEKQRTAWSKPEVPWLYPGRGTNGRGMAKHNAGILPWTRPPWGGLLTLAKNMLFYWEAKKKAKWKPLASANEHKIGERKVTTTFLADRPWLIPPWQRYGWK